MEGLKFDLSDKVRRDSFQVVLVSILIHGSTLKDTDETSRR